MSGESLPPTERSTVRRLPSRGSYDPELIHAVLDEGIVCHVGFNAASGPVVIPMGYARRGDHVILHGSAKSRLMQEIAKGADICVTVTLLDGLVLARSAFHHSMNYRSVVLFGTTEAIDDPGDKSQALDALVEHLIPGRTQDARRASPGEMDATLVVKLPIREASAKVRSGPPVDDSQDLEMNIWAGVIPLVRRPGEPQADAHTSEATGVPDYVRDYPSGRG